MKISLLDFIIILFLASILTILFAISINYIDNISNKCYSITTIDKDNFKVYHTKIYGEIPFKQVFTYKNITMIIREGCEINWTY